jgi:hypothetical protein
VPIEPDGKNWTWVLERPCPQCGFDAGAFDISTVAAAVTANAEEWRALLADRRATTRPDDHTWSATEYACHVRDVFRLYLYRLDLMLTQDGPHFENWDQDATAVEQGYETQRPAEVALELAAAADMLVARYAGLEAADWSRTGFRGDGAAFTIESFTRYLVHDPVHHIWDVHQGYASLGG